jgi:hypothetical protein
VAKSIVIVCSRCEEVVEMPEEHLTPTIPPMLPDMPEHLLLALVGHSCDAGAVAGKFVADLAKTLDPRQVAAVVRTDD